MNIYELSLFNKDTKLTFIYKKSHALAKALYMVTEHFRNEEPLKWTIRAGANCLLEQSLSLSLPALVSTSVEVMSLAEIASFCGLMSDQNFQILKREFESLFEKIDPEKDSLSLASNFLLDEALFKTEERTSTASQGQIPLRDNSLSKIEHTEIKPKRQILVRDKSNRKELILNLLKDKSDLSIKDISRAFKDCSEKTIQRELIQMVDNGTLIKTGERRWSKYSLKTS